VPLGGLTRLGGLSCGSGRRRSVGRLGGSRAATIVPLCGSRRARTLETLLIRLVGIDVDGTLVGSSGIVEASVWEAAERARASGIRIALCSGRPGFGLAVDYARRLDPEGWHVFQNGASIINLRSGESRSAPLPEDQVRALIRKARETRELLELYNDRGYAIEDDAPWTRKHAEILGIPFERRPFESLAPPVVRAQWLVPMGAVPKGLIDNLPGLEIAQSSSPLMPDVRFIGMTRSGVNKGSAITSIAAAYGVDLADVMYIGDADNDLPAFRVVGHAVAMGNAAHSVLDAVERVVGHVDAGGLAEALSIARETAGDRY
jgi:Cof subfamily protein (haloacid dehalogenase superfamily)